MDIRRSLTGAALVVLLGTIGLVGCSSDDKPDRDKTRDTTSQQEETDAPQEEDTDDGAKPEGPTGDKPSKAAVAKGFTTIAKEMLGDELPKEHLADVVDCVVDEVYDDMSVKTLKALAERKLWEIDKADFPLFGAAAEECQKLVTN